MLKAVVDFYSHPLLSPELAAQAHAAYDRLQTQRPPTAAEPRSRLKEHDDDRDHPR